MSASYLSRQRRPELLALGVVGYLLVWIAVFNGYPILYADTAHYLMDSFSLTPPPYRTIGYSLFIRMASLEISPWLVVLAQSAIAIFVLHTFFKFVMPTGDKDKYEPWLFAGLIVFLAVGTSLPWYVGQLMPDVFTGFAFLCVFLLLYDWTLPLKQAVVLSVVLALCVACHLSHFLDLALLLGAVLLLRAFKSAHRFWPVRPLKQIVGFVVVPIVASALFVAASNERAGYGFRLSAGTPVFLLGRLLESGLASDYLSRECQVEQLTACKYVHTLPPTLNAFLWGSHPLLKDMGGWLGAQPEAKRIVYGTIRRYPVRFAAECVKQMLRQFVSFDVNGSSKPFRGGVFAEDVIDSLYPGDSPKIRQTRQWDGSLRKEALRAVPVYTIVFWSCVALGLVLFVKGRARPGPAEWFFLWTVVLLFANAFVTASLSMVEGRYQSRVAWLAGLSCAAFVLPFLVERWSIHSRSEHASREVRSHEAAATQV